MSSPALMLKPLMIVHAVNGQESSDHSDDVVVVLGLPKPRVDWMKFVVCCCMRGVEITKQVTIDKKSGVMGYRWRLVLRRMAQLQQALDQFQRTMPPVSDSLPRVAPRISYPVLDPYMKVYEVDEVDNHYIVTGQPRADSNVPWKGLVSELLMDPGVVDVAKTYKIGPNRIKLFHAWRVIWKVPESERREVPRTPRDVFEEVMLKPVVGTQGDDYPGEVAHTPPLPLASQEARDTQRSIAEMGMSTEEVVQGAIKETKERTSPEVVSESLDRAVGRVKPEPVSLAGERVGQQSPEEIQKAVESYRQQFGMTQGPDGKWRVPLDQDGRVSKVVLFNPVTMRVARVRVEEVTRGLLEGGGRK